MRDLKTDVAVYGGGVAGLWIASHLTFLGLNTVLFESNAIGAGQTIQSQGILHRGGKYVGENEKSLALSTESWSSALSGSGPVDLSKVKIFTKQQLLWMTNRKINKNGYLLRAALAIKGIGYFHEAINPDPTHILPKFERDAVTLNEPVLSVPSLLAELAKPIRGKLIRGHLQGFEESGQNDKQDAVVHIGNQNYKVIASNHICAMGAANDRYVKQLKISNVETRLRPLKQIVLTGELPEFYGIGLSNLFHPTIAIVSHPQPDAGKNAWYIGGHLADGANAQKTDEKIITELKRFLKDCGFEIEIPSLSAHTNYAVRAEASIRDRKNSSRTPVIGNRGNVFLVWPNKLTNTPSLANQLMPRLNNQGLTGRKFDAEEFPPFEPEICSNVPWLQPANI
jgi:glycine/D-amino acid oxidase-like deaminating enzyme